MKLFKLTTILYTCFLCLALAVSVQAQNPKDMVGLGVAAAPEFEGADDYEAIPLVLLDLTWDNHMGISVLGNKAHVNLSPTPVFKAGVAAEYIGERDDVDSDRVDRLPDVDSSFMLGGFVGFEKQNWEGSIEYMADVSDGNDGAIARLNIGYNFSINPGLKTRLGMFTTWADDDYMESYFGITPAGSAVSGLNTYDAESGIKDLGITATIHYMPWKNWGIMGLVSLKTILGDAEDSPVVDTEGDDFQAVVGGMVTYRF